MTLLLASRVFKIPLYTEIDEIKWLRRDDIVGHKIRKIIVSDEGRMGEFYHTSICVQMDHGLWFRLGVSEPDDEEAPLQAKRRDSFNESAALEGL